LQKRTVYNTGSGGTPRTSEVAALTRRHRAVVLDLGGNCGRVWRETAEADANHETLIRDLFDDQYSRPTRIVAFTTMRAGYRDITSAVADEIRQWFAEFDDVPASVQELLDMARR
jgi:hypothetical protein